MNTAGSGGHNGNNNNTNNHPKPSLANVQSNSNNVQFLQTGQSNHHNQSNRPSQSSGQHPYRSHPSSHGLTHHSNQPSSKQNTGGHYHGSSQPNNSLNHYQQHNNHSTRSSTNHSQNHRAECQNISAGGSDPSSTPAPAVDYKLFESIDYPFCIDLSSKYEPIAKIGQGTFGEVHKAKCKKTQDFVALKKVLTENEKEGFPITALREIKILQVLRHENIVRLIEICSTKASAANKFKSQFYLVFEFCEHDLAGLLSNPAVKFTLGEQKKIMQQLLNGLYFIHKNLILHRDMKTANILVTKEGKLKLADFGLARAIVQSDQPTRYTNRVVTLWYRPPELLLGERCYNKAIDIWGSGCIMAELWTREPILKGNSEQNQLELIQSLCGSITPETWPDVEKLELYNKMHLKQDQKRRIKERLGNYVKDPRGLDLLEKLLELDPKKRIDSDEALDHDFFWTDPFPNDLKLDKLCTSMFEYTSQNLRRGGGPHYRPPQKPSIGNDQHFDRVY